MPDWFYRTVARRALFTLSERQGRALALGVIGMLGRVGAGRAVIDFLGHMAPDPRLRIHVAGIAFPSRIGLGWRVDPETRATAGLARFGVGCIELSALGAQGVERAAGETLADETSALSRSAVGSIKAVSSPRTDPPIPLLRRIRDPQGRELVELRPGVILPVYAWDDAPATADTRQGVVLQVGRRLSATAWKVPASPPAGLSERVKIWRETLPSGAPLIVAGGVAGPEHAVSLVSAGADLVLVDAGLVFHGPGLVKRCNEALLASGLVPPVADLDVAARDVALFRHAWPWAVGLGAALFLGGMAVLALAFDRVLLPYDEHYLGISADALRLGSPKLFAFMAHDRGTLAGTMLGLGWFYAMLGRQGVRRATHGAKSAVVASALAGFASFFAFFSFGYFDTLHAFVAVVLFQLTTQIMAGAAGPERAETRLIDVEDAAWRRAQWGQLVWLLHAAGLLVAGAVILGIGMSSVFVSEDLAFLCITPEQASRLGPRLTGVVAHDRATLGGMLLASGVAMSLTTLWCHHRGAAWVWRGILGLGLPAYAAALGVHFWVGYVDWRHLVPAFAGLTLWLVGLGLSHAYLNTKPVPARPR